MASHLADQDGPCFFLSQSNEAPTWARLFAAHDETCPALDLSEALTEVYNTRHRCCVIALTLWLPPEHFHLRIAGVVPARNKMLDTIRPIDPAAYEVIHVPQFLRLADARLRDGTLVRPLLTESGKIYLTLSGILLAGDVSERYVVYRHLDDLGLAGPTAPVLHWSSHVRPPIAGRGILPFRALTDLPAELLATPYPSTSWAFNSAPIMTLPQWENYRQRQTTRVLLSTLLSDDTRPPWPRCLATRERCQGLLTTDMFSNTVLQLWQLLAGGFEHYLGRLVMEFLWRRPASTRGPIP